MSLNRKDIQNLKVFLGIEGKKMGMSSNARPHNSSAMKHGIWANRFLEKSEEDLFFSILERLMDDFEMVTEVDLLQVQLVALEVLKYGRALKTGDTVAAKDLDKMTRGKLRDLKSTRIEREGKETHIKRTSPAEWAAAFVSEYQGKQSGVY